jgi:hypothetical protein
MMKSLVFADRLEFLNMVVKSVFEATSSVAFSISMESGSDESGVAPVASHGNQ